MNSNRELFNYFLQNYNQVFILYEEAVERPLGDLEWNFKYKYLLLYPRSGRCQWFYTDYLQKDGKRALAINDIEVELCDWLIEDIHSEYLDQVRWDELEGTMKSISYYQWRCSGGNQKPGWTPEDKGYTMYIEQRNGKEVKVWRKHHAQ